MPGGGRVVLGLDENAGFAATGLERPSVLLEGLAAMARQALDPPITFEAEQVPFEGSTLVVARVDELPSSAKPCRVGASGKAYLRAHHGDHELSQLEVQALLAARETPTSDTAAVPGTSASDLDPDLLPTYLRSRRAGSPRLAAVDDAEVLRRTGVTTDAGGLWGVTVDRLGRSGVTSARNGRLLQICQHLRSPDDQRVVEALASGIPTVLAAAEAAGLERPRFFDQGIRFSMVLPRRTVGDRAAPPLPVRRGTGVPRLGSAANGRAVVEALGAGPASAAELVEATGLTRRQLQHALAPLREAGQVVLLGSAGDRTSRWSLTG